MTFEPGTPTDGATLRLHRELATDVREGIQTRRVLDASSAAGITPEPAPEAVLLVLEDNEVTREYILHLVKTCGREPVLAEPTIAGARKTMGRHRVTHAILDYVVVNGRARMIIPTLLADGAAVVVFTGERPSIDRDVLDIAERGEIEIIDKGPGAGELLIDWLERHPKGAEVRP